MHRAPHSPMPRLVRHRIGRHRTGLHLLLGAAAILLFSACGGEIPVQGVTVTDSAGVVIVDHPGGDRELGWTAERILTIPPAEDDSQGFFGVRDVEVMPGGRIAVLDGEGKKVVLYDELGNLLKQYGREGSGPGEFQYPLEMAAGGDGGLVVFDLMNRRLERFDSTLAPLAPDPFQVPYYGGHMAFVDSFLVIPGGETRPQQEERPDLLVAMSDTDTVEIVRYLRELGGTVQLESCGMGFSGIPPIFAPTTLWTSGPGGSVVVAGTAGYELDIYQAPDFHLRTRIRRDVPPIDATAAMAKATVGDGMRVMTPAGERVCDADEVVEKRRFAETVPPIAGVAVSTRGEIFLQRWAPEGEPRSIDVLDANGVYQGTLEPGFPFPEAFLGEDRIVRTEEDDLGLRSVVVYRLLR